MAVLVYAGVVTGAAVSASILGGFGALTFTSAWGLLAISVGAVALAFIVDADTAKKTLNKAVEGVAGLAGAVGGVIGGAAGAAAGVSSPVFPVPAS
ncbi:hypothetical protein ER16_Medium2 [Pseudomonas phage ER16]|nr:hypothetical protein ER16_Medium2 [Pseudomonas phage ER16]